MDRRWSSWVEQGTKPDCRSGQRKGKIATQCRVQPQMGGSVTQATSDFAPARLTPVAAWGQLEPHRSLVERMSTNSVIEDILFGVLQPWVGGCEFLDYETAVNGGHGLVRLDKTTSCGFGLSKVFSTKAQAFDQIPGQIEEMVQADLLNLGKAPEDPTKRNYVWLLKESLKDEIRKTAKVLDNQTRLFSAGPLLYTLVERMLYGDLCTKWYAAAKSLKFPGAAGADYFRSGWHRFIQFLTHNGTLSEIFDTDVKLWDKLWDLLWHYDNAVLMARLYKSAHAMLLFLSHEARMQQTPRAVGVLGFVLAVFMSFPSGRAITIIFNSIGQLRILVSLYLKTPQGQMDPTSEGFNTWVTPYVIGDDVAMCTRLNIDMPFVIGVYKDWGWRALANNEQGLPSTVNTFEFAGRRSIWNPTFREYWPAINADRIKAILEYERSHELSILWSRVTAAALLIFPYCWSQKKDELELAKLVLAFYWSVVRHCTSRGMKGPRLTLTDFCKIYSDHAHEVNQVGLAFALSTLLDEIDAHVDNRNFSVKNVLSTAI